MKRIISLASGLLILGVSCAGLAQGVAEGEYAQAKKCYIGARATKDRARWERCIGLFAEVQKKYPDSASAPQALYSEARLRREMYEKLKDDRDVVAAIDIYNRVIREYPDHYLADDALFQIGRLRHDPLGQDNKARRAFTFLLQRYPDGDMAPKAKEEIEALGEGEAPAPVIKRKNNKGDEASTLRQNDRAGNPFVEDVAGPFDSATLEAIDIEDGADATTVRLSFSRKVAYSLEFTGLGRRTGSPPRLDALFSHARPSKALAKRLSVASPYLDRIRLKRGILTSGTRMIFVMAPAASYEVIPDGELVTLRFKRGDGTGPPPRVAEKRSAPAHGKKKAYRIVIDPGHGGSDTGAIGPKGTMEKDVSLMVSRRLARELKRKLGARVFLTRGSDKALSLEERNAFAVRRDADLFISIHANASGESSSHGIETYYLNNATDKAAARLAERENRSSGGKLSAVEHILSTMLQNYDAVESRSAGTFVQEALVRRMGKRYPGVRNRGIRSALFYVLVGAKCPAILVEMSFITNRREERRLRSRHYQDHLAIGIAEGIQKYLGQRGERVVSL